ncbi:MAG: D-alanine--D-alanine ligase [Flavobacteriales bacterium]|nr:D-alanine--D-alanine ligase [Flavobacteriales bacterium]|tara:strand:+ start:4905 stop:5900 length:996 start_codon:yes stop_codon:yes gene_type:complete
MLIKDKSIVGVACGGYGSERDISLKSAIVVYENLKKRGWNVFLLNINMNNWFIEVSKTKKIPLNTDDFSFKLNKTLLKIDIVFNAIHGPPGEDGQLANKLKLKNIPHTSCDLYAAALTYDKRGCLSNVKKFKIPTAKSVHLNQGEPINLNQIISKVGLPCFVKANRAGSSFGVYKILKKKDLIKGIKKAYNEDSQLIIESELKGREVSVGVYKKNNKVICLPITEIISENEFFDYEAKYMGKAKEITPAKIPVDWEVKVNKIAKSLYENLNLKGVCRSEFIFVENKPHLLEINTVPGLTEESIIPKQCKAAGIKLGVFFEDLLNEVTLKNS